MSWALRKDGFASSFVTNGCLQNTSTVLGGFCGQAWSLSKRLIVCPVVPPANRTRMWDLLQELDLQRLDLHHQGKDLRTSSHQG